MKVLFIEDEADAREISLRLIEESERVFQGEVQIIPADTLAVAEALVKTEIFDAAFLDLGLPDSHRNATMSSIPDFRHRWKIPIFILTGSEEIEIRDRCLMMGADEFTTKKKLISSCGCILERLYNMIVKYRRDAALK